MDDTDDTKCDKCNHKIDGLKYPVAYQIADINEDEDETFTAVYPYSADAYNGKHFITFIPTSDDRIIRLILEHVKEYFIGETKFRAHFRLSTKRVYKQSNDLQLSKHKHKIDVNSFKKYMKKYEIFSLMKENISKLHFVQQCSDCATNKTILKTDNTFSVHTKQIRDNANFHQSSYWNHHTTITIDSIFIQGGQDVLNVEICDDVITKNDACRCTNTIHLNAKSVIHAFEKGQNSSGYFLIEAHNKNVCSQCIQEGEARVKRKREMIEQRNMKRQRQTREVDELWRGHRFVKNKLESYEQSAHKNKDIQVNYRLPEHLLDFLVQNHGSSKISNKLLQRAHKLICSEEYSNAPLPLYTNDICHMIPDGDDPGIFLRNKFEKYIIRILQLDYDSACAIT